MNPLKFYIDGQWVSPTGRNTIDVINPATEEVCQTIAAGGAGDVNVAVAAATKAFASFSQTTKAERLSLLKRILDIYNSRLDAMAEAISTEMGAPLVMAKDSQAYCGSAHFEAAITALEAMEFEEQRGKTRIVREAIGVVGLITPWNWPMNQIVTKVAPALAAGCTMVLKPSELAPSNALLFAQILHDAGVPAGVFNLINGDGPSVGQPLAAHPDVAMMSFTGSTRAGIIVAKTAADTVKRVSQELGGKSANIILDDADLAKAVSKGVRACMSNSGQSCNAPTRMLVPADRQDEALNIAAKTAAKIVTGDPRDPKTDLGPVVSQAQFNKIQGLIEIAIKEGNTLVAGGTGRPGGMNHGFYVQPTIFGHVERHHTIAIEEVFGPVLAIMPYKDEADAIEIANDTVYGLAGYVQSGNLERARKVARQIRAGQVNINHPDWDTFQPFGGYKQSGNGREYADWGIHDFLEIKGIGGWDA
ncbi:MAG: aldehyde dehydrogenase family protein [Rhizobiaceae bacterium]